MGGRAVCPGKDLGGRLLGGWRGREESALTLRILAQEQVAGDTFQIRASDEALASFEKQIKRTEMCEHLRFCGTILWGVARRADPPGTHTCLEHLRAPGGCRGGRLEGSAQARRGLSLM